MVVLFTKKKKSSSDGCARPRCYFHTKIIHIMPENYINCGLFGCKVCTVPRNNGYLKKYGLSRTLCDHSLSFNIQCCFIILKFSNNIGRTKPNTTTFMD